MTPWALLHSARDAAHLHKCSALAWRWSPAALRRLLILEEGDPHPLPAVPVRGAAPFAFKYRLDTEEGRLDVGEETEEEAAQRRAKAHRRAGLTLPGPSVGPLKPQAEALVSSEGPGSGHPAALRLPPTRGKVPHSDLLSTGQSLSHVQLFAIPWTVACQASLSITNSQSLLKLMSLESVAF